MLEIERKFLVNDALWEQVSKPNPAKIIQGYLSSNPECTVRVRVKNQNAFLTIKGKNKGIVRSEFEYEIPVEEAKEMLQTLTNKSIEKDRYAIPIGRHIWEVDVFHGKLKGLILAEIELTSEYEKFEIPNWIEKEVSDDPYYYNSNLIKVEKLNPI